MRNDFAKKSKDLDGAKEDIHGLTCRRSGYLRRKMFVIITLMSGIDFFHHGVFLNFRNLSASWNRVNGESSSQQEKPLVTTYHGLNFEATLPFETQRDRQTDRPLKK
jgi:hypothetical protein